MDRFVHLHVHSHFSLWDGLDTPASIARRAAELGQLAVALTDHGVVYGLVEHYRACREVGIEPILGCEMYVVEELEKDGARKAKPAHVTVLVADRRGYSNLMRLVSASTKLVYYKPRISLGMLAEAQDGLIVLSGCSSSLAGRALAAGDVDRARRILARMASELRGRFYGEVQHHEAGRELARLVVQEAARLKFPVVATGDTHYVEKRDKLVHDLMLGVRKKGSGEDDPSYGRGYHVTSRSELRDLLLRAHGRWASRTMVERWLDATVEVASRVELSFEKPSPVLPRLWGPEAYERLERLALEGLRRRKLDGRKEYAERLERELRVVRLKDLAEYFLVIHDVVSWSKEQGILVGPRGSVCGSLLAYALGITAIDPLVHGTIFERFLHEEKQTLPDVDLDFDSRYRDRVIDYVLRRFAGYAFPIISFGRYAAGNLAKDAGVMFGMKEYEVQALKDSLNEMRYRQKKTVLTVEDLERSATVGDLIERYPGLQRTLLKLFGQVRYVGRHPAGVCFVPDKDDPYRWLAPLVGKDGSTTPYSYVDIESLGLVKFDFLSLDSLTAIAKTLEGIEQRHGERIRIDDIPLDDEQVYGLIAEGRTDGIFQLVERGAQDLCRAIKVESFAELVAAVSLNRPGVSDQIERYIRNKRSTKEPERFPETYGAIVYQEQVMQELRDLGLSWAETDKFLKSVKSLGSFTIGKEVEERQPMRGKIIDLLKRRRGWSDRKARLFVDRLSGYYFNKAHATGYAFVAYIMAWLRVHYPIEFWAAVLDAENSEYKRMVYERRAAADGIILLPPHVNGTAGYSVEGNAIRVGLSTIKGIGDKTLEAIVAHQPYEKPEDILRIPRKQMNVRVVRALKASKALLFDRERLVKWAVQFNRARREERSRR